MALILELCQNIVKRIDGACRCTALQLRDEQILADVLCLCATVKLDATSLETIARALRFGRRRESCQTFETGLKPAKAIPQLVQVSAVDCQWFGISSQNTELAIILLAKPNADWALTYETLQEAILDLERIMSLKRKSERSCA